MRQLIHLASHRCFQGLHRQPQQDNRSPFNQWMNPIQLSVLFFLLSGSHALFAADINPKSSQSILDLIRVIMWGIAVPALVIGGIGLGIYTWIRRNKSSLSRFFRKRFRTGKPPSELRYSSTLPPTYPPSRVVNSSEAEREQVAPSLPEPQTLEAISLKDLEQVLTLRERRRIHEYYDAIAMIIKRYVGEKYQIKILDATTGQILQALPHDLTDIVVDHVGEILRMCDMVQLSRHRPSRSELDRIYQTAKEFLESQIVVPSAETNAPEDENEIDEDYDRYRRMMM